MKKILLLLILAASVNACEKTCSCTLYMRSTNFPVATMNADCNELEQFALDFEQTDSTYLDCR